MPLAESFGAPLGLPSLTRCANDSANPGPVLKLLFKKSNIDSFGAPSNSCMALAFSSADFDGSLVGALSLI